jgi:hypothetical protein
MYVLRGMYVRMCCAVASPFLDSPQSEQEDVRFYQSRGGYVRLGT